MKKVVVVGGGTAGWFTALLVRAYYPHVKIILIESDEIGILGAGEGTTPHFGSLLEEINISLSDVIKEADATIKNGIRFINWNGDGTDYFHSFNPEDSLNQITNFTVLAAQLKRYSSLKEIDFACKLTDQNRVPFAFNHAKAEYNQSPFGCFDKTSNWGIHFNARKFAAFLSKRAQQRDILRLEGKVVGIHSDNNGNVTGLTMDNEPEPIECDFVFDCTGFARLFVGKHFKTEWHSYSDYLPMNTGLPFFIDHDNDVVPETKSIAMSSGWIWQIPVRDRYGCGYVFDNNYINEEQALSEAEQYFQRKLTVPKVFRFQAGSYTKTMVRNCLAIGLSQSFVEPLEATSLWVAYANLQDFLKCNGLYMQSEVFEKTYNRRCLKRNEDVRDFLYLHYLTSRQDSKFWKEFRQRHPMISSVQEDLELLTNFSNVRLTNDLFGNLSWIQVSHGLNLLDTSRYKETFQNVDQQFAENLRHWCELKQNSVVDTCFDHKEFIEFMCR